MIAASYAPLRAVRVSLLLLLVLQSACSTLPETSTRVPADWQHTIEHRSQISAWKVRGRLGVQTENDGGSLDLFWNQQGDAYTIRLIAAFGQGTILIRGDASGVHIKTRDVEDYAENADALLASTLGIEMPVTALRDWLRGLPMANTPVSGQRWDSQGYLYRLNQADWQVEMSQYQPVGDYVLPHAFYLGREDRPELGIRLLIREWQIEPA